MCEPSRLLQTGNSQLTCSHGGVSHMSIAAPAYALVGLRPPTKRFRRGKAPQDHHPCMRVSVLDPGYVREMR